jgi:peptidoglycan hydrolase CwlO-like protein
LIAEPININLIMSSTTTTKLILDIDVHLIHEEEYSVQNDISSLQTEVRLLQAELAQAKINTSHMLFITQLQTDITKLQAEIAEMRINVIQRINLLENRLVELEIKCIITMTILALTLVWLIVVLCPKP